mmetsp:Transcript_16551/g.66811  ORF Transcript_16551/g.66811 Transcript_16551/m.66811 type:complete len:420 (-) Transcript_16551:188-1447(-)
MSVLTKTSAARAEFCARRARTAQRRFRIDAAPGCHDVEALEWLDEAARCFAVAEKPRKASECHKRGAEACLRLDASTAMMGGGATTKTTTDDDILGACAQLAWAAEALEAASPAEAADLYNRAVELACDVDRWDLAACLALKSARLADAHEVVEHGGDASSSTRRDRAARYVACADLWAAAVDRRAKAVSPSGLALRDSCLSEAAKELALGASDYAEAAELFERVGVAALESNLTSLNAPRYFFKAALCGIARGDLDFAAGKLRVYDDACPAFAAAAERLFCDHVIECFLLDEDEEDLGAPLHQAGASANDDDDSADDSDDERAARRDVPVRRRRLRDEPDLDGFVDRCYDLATVRDLDAFELKMLARVHATVRERIARHARKLDRARRREERRARRAAEELERRARVARDLLPPSRGH